MKFALYLVALSAVGALSTAVVRRSAAQPVTIPSTIKGITYHRPQAFRKPVKDVVAKHHQTLRPLNGDTTQRSAAGVLHALSKLSHIGHYQNISSIPPYSTQYAIDVDWNGKLVSMILDTGSSDTWTVMSNFSCVSPFGEQYNQSDCGFGPNYVDDFSYGQEEDVHMAVEYASGDFVSGPLGQTDLTVAGITVRKQTVALANRTFWFGNNVTNGILGLAYPPLTSAFYGNSTEHRQEYSISYTPFVSSMVAQGLTQASFSVAISRNSSEGMIAWGGLPPVDLSVTWAETDLVIVCLLSNSRCYLLMLPRPTSSRTLRQRPRGNIPTIR